MKDDILHPKPSLLCKLASIAVHADELMSKDGHAFDRVALEQAIADPEVVEWIEAMTKQGMAPKKRLPLGRKAKPQEPGP